LLGVVGSLDSAPACFARSLKCEMKKKEKEKKSNKKIANGTQNENSMTVKRQI
jgi:hypothetical protein